MLVGIVVNLTVISFTFYHLFKAKAVMYECKAGIRLLIPALFFLIGLVSYLKYSDIVSLITFITLVICGGLYYIIPSGLAKDSFVISGRLYNYQDCDEIKLNKNNNRLELSFVYKKRTHFLFKELDAYNDLKMYVTKIRKEGKL